MDNNDSEEVSQVPIVELFLTADGMRLFKIRRTVMEMLRDRGYYVSDLELRWSPDQFRAAFGPSPTRNKLNFCTTKLSDPEESILVIFPEVPGKEKASIGKPTIVECGEAMKKNGTRRAILVVQKPLTPFAKQMIVQMDKEYAVDVFQEAELLVNVMDSVFVPKHQILLPEEEKAVLEKYFIPASKQEQLPKLQRTDPVARYLGLQKGQIIKIVRSGNWAPKNPRPHETVNYRLVT